MSMLRLTQRSNGKWMYNGGCSLWHTIPAMGKVKTEFKQAEEGQMRKVVFAINITIDGFCGHEAVIAADDELHEYFTGLLRDSGSCAIQTLKFSDATHIT
ncbi:MAG: hypothetical protein L6Q49_01915 [Anaerolineales bacterium]|nr:hypothetical protein [Anaerolineales bacterium]